MLDPDLLATHRQELRRGTTVLACLVVLTTPDYGYALLDRLASMGVHTEANTLYPLLRRLESQGLLTSDWDTQDARPRKFYRTSEAGTELAQQLYADWATLYASLTKIQGDPRS
ncbi:MAG: PadR family transcriptional regulator [Actinobacteria bacterium HGW-Actinobacteria-4]|nr:MAG: PadR family transcriptional regulator [Actinobacteria bacterium HGW-Actinobacteria-4]